jgi:ABC-type multidrug transport system permease subunit
MRTRDEQLQLIGWWLFVACAVLYIVASIESGSLASFLGGIFFLLACFFFMIPLIWKQDGV